MSNDSKDMSFVDHLEDLRWTLFRSIVSVGVFGVIAFLNKNFVFETILFGPTRPDFFTYKFLCEIGEKINFNFICIDTINYTVVNLELAGQFMTHVTTSIGIGFIFAFPYLIFEIWRFIKPGLHDLEVKASRSVLFFSAILFFIGVLFGYFVLIPFGINFLSTYNVSSAIQNTFSLSNYIGFISMFVLMSGIMFELPIAVFLLAKIGIVDDTMMIEHRKHAVIVIFIIAAIITPADVGTMIVVAIPIWILYEISIGVAAMVSKNNKKKLKTASI